MFLKFLVNVVSNGLKDHPWDYERFIGFPGDDVWMICALTHIRIDYVEFQWPDFLVQELVDKMLNDIGDSALILSHRDAFEPGYLWLI